MHEIIRFILCALCMVTGIVSIFLSVLGVFKFRFVLNRMHCSAVIDTMGALFILTGVMIASGAPSYVLKILAILMFLWIGSPIASHLVSRTELLTDDEALKHMDAPEETKEESNDIL